jgi:peptidoglycan/xylan/chitin deacetylase (PgdA/CDA1 family)
MPVAALVVVALLIVVVLTTSGGGKPGAGAGQAADGRSATKPHRPQRQPPRQPPRLAWPANSTAKVSGPHNRPAPILMYHVVAKAPANTPYPDLWVSPQDFKGQMNWLAANGYTGITMKQLFDYWDKGYALPKKPIVVSFDDGYMSDATVVRQVLVQHRWPGVLNLELNNVGSRRSGFSAGSVRSMIADGWEIDSHTVTHPDLTTVGPAQLKFELTASRRRIERKYGVPADFFCYPSGRYNATVVAAVKRAGYRGATTTLMGAGDRSQPYELKRVRIDGTDGVNGFAAKLRQTGR